MDIAVAVDQVLSGDRESSVGTPCAFTDGITPE